MTPIQILKIVSSDQKPDTKLIEAGIACSHACALDAHGNGRTQELYQNSGVVTKCIHKLFDNLDKHGVVCEEHLSAINPTAKVAEILQLADAPEGVKSLGETLRSFADSIRIEKPKFTLTHLELLVNTRRFNKRLPKELSAYIKDVIDGDVHSIGNYWDKFSELSTLKGQLRKLWIQCASLNLYNYNPDTSYTQKLISDIVPSVLQSEDPEVHYLFNFLIHDCKIESIAINNYDSILNNLLKQKDDKASTLLLNAAILLNKLNAPLSSWINDIPDSIPSKESGTTMTTATTMKTGEAKASPYDLQSTLKHHPTWAQLATDFVRLQAKGMSMKEFCQKNRLSEPAFTEFYRAVIKDIENDIHQDPFLSKLTSLPHKVQDEFTELMERKKEILERLCEAVSGITGEKVEVNDILNAADNKNPLLDKKLQKAFDNLGSVNPRYALTFMSAFPELKKVESQIAAFLAKYNL